MEVFPPSLSPSKFVFLGIKNGLNTYNQELVIWVNRTTRAVVDG